MPSRQYATRAGRAEPIEVLADSRGAAMCRWGRANARSGLAAGLAACAMTAFAVMAPVGPALDARAGSPLLVNTAWKIRKSPNATVPGGQLNSVSCSAANACTAVGAHLSTSGVNVTLAERWNGTSWHRQRTPNLPNDTAPTDTSAFPRLSGPTKHCSGP